MENPVSISTDVSSLSSSQVSVGPAPVQGRAIQTSYPTSQAQLEIWLSSLQSTEANCSYNEISSLVFRGEMDIERMRNALASVVERNSSLRTTFSSDGQVAEVATSVHVELQVVDLSIKTPAESVTLQKEIVTEQAHLPFDLGAGPLLRCVLQRISPRHHKLTFSAHHIIMDGWSMAVFCRDLGWFYDQLGEGNELPLPTAGEYQDYSEKMQTYFKSPEGQADEQFWVEQFSDSIPVLDLPISTRRPALRTYTGGCYEHSFSKELIERVRKVGAKSGCSLFNVTLSAFSAYVARISGSDDFCIGIPTAGQAAMDEGELIGHCVNALPWRTKVVTSDPFLQYMTTSRGTLLNALDHQCYSYGTLLRKLSPPRDPARAPMLSISFNLDPVIDTSKMGFAGLDVHAVIEPRSFENFEWFVNGVIQKDKSVEMQVQYNSDLFSAEAMKFYFEGFEAFLLGIAKAPESPIADLPLMSVSQRAKAIVDLNQTAMDYPVDATLHEEFSRQATETPEKIAVSFENNALTYAEVESRSNQIARYLQQQGVAAGDLVGICVDRSAQMLVLLYGIMKSGAGYVPLDPAYPADRLQYMCDHSGLKLVVTESELQPRVAKFNKPMLVVNDADAKAAIDQLDSTAVEPTASPSDICYVIYTSGSTGKPKGVQVPHGAVVNFLYSMKEQPGFIADDSVLAVTTLSFDIAVLELYLPTIFGGNVVIADSYTAADGAALISAIAEHKISLMQATPATWRLMIGAGWSGNSDLKVLCGGEPMPRDLVAPLLERCSELWNMYGPTETTVWSAVFQITDAEAPILIGKPIGNTQIYIMDEQGNDVPIGCEGELYIGGAGVTLGYRNRQDLTDERFVENRYRDPFSQYVSDRLYKTGDLAKFRFDGNVEFLRRNDKQVKVRGFRIELGEIENGLSAHADIAQNVVIVREDTVGDARLVAYCITKPGQSLDVSQLKDHLRGSLPYYMIPQNFVELESFPQTNNGKIDYKALPAPRPEAASAQTAEVSKQAERLPQTPAEKYLAGVWEEILEIDDIELNDNFFDVGGHSLLVMRVIAAVKEKTGTKLGPQDFLMGTLEQLADRLSDSFGQTDATATAQTPSEPQAESIAAATEGTVGSVPSNAESSESKPPATGGILRSLKGFWEGSVQE